MDDTTVTDLDSFATFIDRLAGKIIDDITAALADTEGIVAVLPIVPRFVHVTDRHGDCLQLPHPVELVGIAVCRDGACRSVIVDGGYPDVLSEEFATVDEPPQRNVA